jgi:uncharacterized protein YhaN
MQIQSDETKARLEMLESRVQEAEAKVNQLTELLAGLTTVTQQLMKANNVVLEAAKEIHTIRSSTRKN